MPKLALRDLFAIVTIFALGLGWWLDRSRLKSENTFLREQQKFAELVNLIRESIEPITSGE